jgi:hypothetical protein
MQQVAGQCQASENKEQRTGCPLGEQRSQSHRSENGHPAGSTENRHMYGGPSVAALCRRRSPKQPKPFGSIAVSPQSYHQPRPEGFCVASKRNAIDADRRGLVRRAAPTRCSIMTIHCGIIAAELLLCDEIKAHSPGEILRSFSYLATYGVTDRRLERFVTCGYAHAPMP